jgi:GTPase-associated protein 1, C-terminal domain/GTPase-associated protein 1, N-terminal domain type 2/GTPase-associated protein 1, middle domain
MTAGGFDRLLYTDCVAGTGRGAGNGFQVQSQSAGIEPTQVTMAVGWLLYDRPDTWIASGRAVQDFPLGFAHAAESGYGTAQSRYLGTSVSSPRPGNHLADCLLTRDADLYGPLRPAQLWRSPLWRAEPWDSTECAQVSEPLVPGPLTVEATADWLRDRPERAPALGRLVSVLESAEQRRVIVVADDPETTLLWITAATLLLPAHAALQVSFKVFATQPDRAKHRITGVSRELYPRMAPGSQGSAFVLDGDRAISDEAEVSPRAAFWADLLATADDPYDVVDAVELSAAIGGGTVPDWPEARITAWALTVPDYVVTDPAPLFSWLEAADGKLQQEHGPGVVSRLLAAGTNAVALRWIDAAVAAGRVDADPKAVRVALLTAEIAESRAGREPVGQALSALRLADSEQRDAESQMSSAIALSAGSDRLVELLLRLAGRHGISPPVQQLREHLHAFAVGWIDHPERDYRLDQWALREEVLDLCHDELQRRLASGGFPAVAKALSKLWRYLSGRSADTDDPLASYLAVAAIRSGPGGERPAMLSALLTTARRGRRASAAIADIQQAMVGWQLVGPTEALLIVRDLPADVPVDPAVAKPAVGQLGRQIARPTALMLDALAALERRGLAPEGDAVAALLASDRRVLGFLDATQARKFRDDPQWQRKWLTALGKAEPAVVGARLTEVLGACLEFPQPGLGAEVLEVLPGELRGPFVNAWQQELGGQRWVRAAVEGYYWHANTRTGAVRSRVAEVFSELNARLPDADRDRLLNEVSGALPAEAGADWAALLGYKAPKASRWMRKDGAR